MQNYSSVLLIIASDTASNNQPLLRVCERKPSVFDTFFKIKIFTALADFKCLAELQSQAANVALSG